MIKINAYKNVIVRLPNWVGDLVMALPILEDLHLAMPNARVTALLPSHLAPLLWNHPYVDEVMTFEKVSGWIHKFHRQDIIERLQMGKYDLGILATNSLSSAWWFWRGNVKDRIGYVGNGRRFLLTQALRWPENREEMHYTTLYKGLLAPLGIALSETMPEVYITENERLKAETFLRKYGVDFQKNRVVGINPGAAYGSSKCWPKERFKQLAELLLKDEKCVLLFFGDYATAPLISQIVEDFSERVIDLAGKTSLRQLASLLQVCDVVVSNDSGPMHIAAALRRPLVAIFGSTNPKRSGPVPNGCVIRKEVPCSPCYKRVCPIDFPCMKKITAQEVYEKVQQYLAK